MVCPLFTRPLFTPEQILLAVEEKLGLSSAQLQQIRPVIEEQSQALHQTIEELRERGFLNLESLPEKFSVIAERAKKQLATHLTAEQLAALETVSQQIQQTSKEEIMDALAAHLAHVLEIEKEQLASVLLILRDEIEQRHQLLACLIHEPERSASVVIEELKVIQTIKMIL